MAEHRVPMLGDALRRRRDPARSSDPKVRQLISALAALDVAPAPRPAFRAELRAQLVAVTPRLVREGEPAVRTAASKSAKPADAEAPRRSGFRFAKPLVAVVGALAACILLLGGAVLLSRNALPGDSLYGLKRASENTEYRLAGGAVDRGTLKLEFAKRRIGEVADLLRRANAMAAGRGALADGGQLNSDTTELVREALASADGDMRSAAQLLGQAAVQDGSSSPLRVITSWTPAQLDAMTAIVARIPSGSAHIDAVRTRHLVIAVQQRARTLTRQLSCGCLDATGTDELGPLPCARSGCAPGPTGPGGRNTSPPGGGQPTGTTSPVIPRRGGLPPVPTDGATPGTAVRSSKRATPAPDRTSATPGVPIPPVAPVPSLPSLPSLPALPTLPGPSAVPGSGAVPTANPCLISSLVPVVIGVGNC